MCIDKEYKYVLIVKWIYYNIRENTISIDLFLIKMKVCSMNAKKSICGVFAAGTTGSHSPGPVSRFSVDFMKMKKNSEIMKLIFGSLHKFVSAL